MYVLNVYYLAYVTFLAATRLILTSQADVLMARHAIFPLLEKKDSLMSHENEAITILTSTPEISVTLQQSVNCL